MVTNRQFSCAVSVSRFALSPFRLPGGSTVPAGVSVSAPSMMVNLDDSLWTDPTSFDGYRFEKLRTIKGNEQKFQYASTRYDSGFQGDNYSYRLIAMQCIGVELGLRHSCMPWPSLCQQSDQAHDCVLAFQIRISV
ncbi:unnamed protein product [Aspergillus oryzae var. brunneus]|uniref:Unnamed protein product n=2 Tax=Aspergillus oryzae TaxID=5062 RepID=A0AAN4Y8E8_ASPOZ|nr:unnamed protein product [Aspergillus oryzae]GMG45919.1 unnamed protein product [Aspergillus oryzae var. brunneus]